MNCNDGYAYTVERTLPHGKRRARGKIEVDETNIGLVNRQTRQGLQMHASVLGAMHACQPTHPLLLGRTVFPYDIQKPNVQPSREFT